MSCLLAAQAIVYLESVSVLDHACEDIARFVDTNNKRIAKVGR
jgi:hypothetical protein